MLFHYSAIVGDMSPIYRRHYRRESIIGFGLMLFHLQKLRRHVGGMLATFFKNQNFDFQRHVVYGKKFSSPRINNSIWLDTVPLATLPPGCCSHSWSSKNIVPIRDGYKIESKVYCAYRAGLMKNVAEMSPTCRKWNSKTFMPAAMSAPFW